MMIKKQPTLLNKLQYLLGVKRQNNSFFIKKKMVKQKAQLILKRITKKKIFVKQRYCNRIKSEKKRKKKEIWNYSLIYKKSVKGSHKINAFKYAVCWTKKNLCSVYVYPKKKKKKTK